MSFSNAKLFLYVFLHFAHYKWNNFVVKFYNVAHIKFCKLGQVIRLCVVRYGFFAVCLGILRKTHYSLVALQKLLQWHCVNVSFDLWLLLFYTVEVPADDGTGRCSVVSDINRSSGFITSWDWRFRTQSARRHIPWHTASFLAVRHHWPRSEDGWLSCIPGMSRFCCYAELLKHKRFCL